MKIATIAALALTLALPSLAQQSATKIVTENGQPTLAWMNSSRPGCAAAGRNKTPPP